MDLKNSINMALTGLGTAISILIGEWSSIITILMVLIVIDYITGIMNGFRNKEISSEIGHKGLMRKIGIFIAVILAHQIDLVTAVEVPVVRTMTIYFYISNEGISIIENLTELGVPLPRIIINTLKKIKEENDKKSR